MAEREVRVERLLGARVRDDEGRDVGRIEEIVAERTGDACLVRAYLVGAYGLLERLAAWGVARAVFRLVRARRARTIPWDRLDLADPDRPRLRGRAADLG